MRVTESMRMSLAQSQLDKTSQRVHELTDQASSGLKISRPSDGPAAYASIVRRSDKLARLDSRSESLTRAQGDLEVAESALASAGNVMVRARELAVQLADGSYGADERAAAAAEVGLMREQLMAIANTQGSRGYLFGGSATNAPPVDATGAFVGNDAAMLVEYADGKTMAANVSGQSAFAGGRDILRDLADLQALLAANDATGVHGMIGAMDQGHQQVVTARADAGVRIDRLASAMDVTASAKLVTTKQQADEQNIDPAASFMDLSAAQSAYERTLAVTRQLLSMASALERF